MTFKDLFGKPGENFHAARLFGFAFNDIAATLLLSYIISIYSRYKSVWKIFILLVCLGEILHILFGVDTAFIKILKSIAS